MCERSEETRSPPTAPPWGRSQTLTLTLTLSAALSPGTSGQTRPADPQVTPTRLPGGQFLLKLRQR